MWTCYKLYRLARQQYIEHTNEKEILYVVQKLDIILTGKDKPSILNNQKGILFPWSLILGYVIMFGGVCLSRR